MRTIHKCTHCNYEFGYKEILHHIFRTSKDIECKSCESKYKQEKSRKYIFSFITLVPCLIPALIRPGFIEFMIFVVLYEFTIVLLSPFIIKFEE